ncbi:MAG: MoaD/ThiS family protein [Desulfonatronovibrionaceae bacterium]
MIELDFKAFSFLQARLRASGIAPQSRMQVKNGCTVGGLIAELGLDQSEVEGVFVNGRIRTPDYYLQDGDRVAFVPPGTPGPYRYMLGIREANNSK